MSPTLKGTIAGLVAAICYGLIPLFTIPLKNSEAAHQLSDCSIMFYRFALATVIIAVLMLITRRSFKITRGELVTLTYLAFLSDGSALFLIDGYNYLSSGVATTIHFMYPVVTTIMMMVFYNEARKGSTLLAVLLAVVGVGVLSWQSNGETSLHGVIIELISACCYAFYLIRVNRSRVRNMDGMKLTFYVMGIGALIFGAEALRQDEFQMITTGVQVSHLLLLGIVCTVVTNLCLVMAVQRIGSTMTAVLGALEPLTAVALGCLLMGEDITLNVVLGICLIIPSVIIIIFTRAKHSSAA
ncbi:MAG: DMT family transporter [Bacteroidales bacterium]|nr:DMT family transporter [Bacteroidales bacterium]